MIDKLKELLQKNSSGQGLPQIPQPARGIKQKMAWNKLGTVWRENLMHFWAYAWRDGYNQGLDAGDAGGYERGYQAGYEAGAANMLAAGQRLDDQEMKRGADELYRLQGLFGKRHMAEMIMEQQLSGPSIDTDARAGQGDDDEPIRILGT